MVMAATMQQTLGATYPSRSDLNMRISSPLSKGDFGFNAVHNCHTKGSCSLCHCKVMVNAKFCVFLGFCDLQKVTLWSEMFEHLNPTYRVDVFHNWKL